MKKNLWKTVFKKFEGIWSALGRPYPSKFFKRCFLQILFGSFLNTLSIYWVFSNYIFIAPTQGQLYQLKIYLKSFGTAIRIYILFLKKTLDLLVSQMFVTVFTAMLLSILKKKLRLCQDTGKMIYVVLHVDFPCSSQNIFYGYKSFAFLTLFPLNILGCCSPDCNHVTFLIILFYFIFILFLMLSLVFLYATVITFECIFFLFFICHSKGLP